MASLALRNVTKRFDDNLVLDDITLELADGELLVLLGPSGCGKSTLLRVIAGLEECDGGEVYLNDRRIDRLRPRDRNVSLVFQNYALYPHMTIEKNLGFPLKIAKVPRSKREARVREIANLLGLADKLSQKPGQLSGGQRQRVALGRAIIRKPDIFLLDEPLSNLDADLRLRMRQEIVSLQRRLGRPMIHVTHDQVEALTMADRIGLLNEGKLQQIGTPEDLYAEPANRFVAEFIGQPKINMVAGRVVQNRVMPFGLELEDQPDREVFIGIRPESLELRGDAPFAATVKMCEYLGDHYAVELDFKGQILTAAPLTRPLDTGREVRFGLDQTRLLFFAPDGTRLNLRS